MLAYHYPTRRSEAEDKKVKSGSSSTNTSTSEEHPEPDSADRRHAPSSTNGSGHITTRQINRYKLKVELCKNYSLHKSCPYELNCRFAHGVEELLEATQNYSTFRTKKCKSYFT